MIFIDDEAYKEFKKILTESNVEYCNIRIGIDNYTCRGPIFGVSPGTATTGDDVEKINEITFIVDKSLNKQFGGFIIVSNKENNNQGVGLKPVVQSSLGCRKCCKRCGNKGLKG
jgi:HesB-like selenoprotein